MNTERVLALALAIETESDGIGFNMTVPFHKDSCGTMACIGGHCRAIWPPADMELEFIEEATARALEIDEVMACDLCYPRGVVSMSLVDKTKAVKVLRHLAATGMLDWSA